MGSERAPDDEHGAAAPQRPASFRRARCRGLVPPRGEALLAGRLRSEGRAGQHDAGEQPRRRHVLPASGVQPGRPPARPVGRTGSLRTPLAAARPASHGDVSAEAPDHGLDDLATTATSHERESRSESVPAAPRRELRPDLDGRVHRARSRGRRDPGVPPASSERADLSARRSSAAGSLTGDENRGASR